MVNSRESLAKIPSMNNDANPYIITLDIYKEGYWAYDISNYYKGRVDDNGTPFMVRWFEHGQLKNVQGLRPFIRGTVGQHTVDDQTDPDNPKVVPSPDCSQIDQTGETTDTEPGGIAIYRMVNQCFTQEGMFYGEIGLKDSSGLVLSSVDIAFKVLGGHMNMLGARKFYVSELEKAWLDLQAKIKQYNSDYKNATQQQAEQFKEDTENALADLTTKIANEIKRAEDTLGDTQASIDANLASLKLLATHIGALEAQLTASDVVSVSDFNAKTDYLDKSINNRLSQIDTNIEAFSDLSALSAKYPNGHSGLFYAAGHLYIYNNGWIDQGAYPSAALTENEKEILDNAIFTKAFLYDPKQVVAPYNDADLFPTNTVVTFATDMSQVLHAPTQLNGVPYSNGTFITIGNSKDGTFHDEPKDGTFQEFISDSGYKLTRMLWEGNWTKWRVPSDDGETSIFIYDDSQVVAPYNDANLFPTNTVLTFATDMTKVQNVPMQSNNIPYLNGTFITIGNSQDGTFHGTPKDGTFQEFISNSGYKLTRRLWKGNWTNWLGSSDDGETYIFLYDPKQVVAPYNDADLFPTNTVVTFATDMSQVLHAPTQLNGIPYSHGTLITIGNSQDGTFHGTPKDGTFQEFISDSGFVKRRRLWGGQWTKWLGADGTPELSPSDKEFKLAKVSLSMFGKFGVIGDSYASGTLEDFKNFSQDTFADTPDEMKNNLCWGEMLARKWGTSMLHLAKEGLHTRSWLTDDQGLTKLNSSDPQDIYYLVLGINDYYGLGETYLGQESDIENKSDTFYGNYGKIISAIKQKAPLAKIIMFGVAGNEDIQKEFSNAQKKIAEHFNIPFISENEDPLFSSDYYTSSMGSGHPSSYLYGAMANAFERLIQLAVYRYRPYFYNYGWNGKIADPTNIEINDYNPNHE